MLRPRSMRMSMIIVMALLVVLQSTVLILALVSSRVFFALDAEAFRLFEGAIDARAEKFNKRIQSLMANTAVEAQQFSHVAAVIATRHHLPLGQIATNEALFAEVADAAAETVLSLLHNNSVTGAYVVFDGAPGRQNPQAHAAVYISDSAPGLVGRDNSQYLMDVGPAFISQARQIALSRNWDTVLDFSREFGGAFYYLPIETVATHPDMEWARRGYWAVRPSFLRPGSRAALSYSLPLMGGAGGTFGVIGVEITQSHFAQDYLPSTDIPYETGFYAIARSTGEEIDLDWHVPSGPLAQAYLVEGQKLPVRPVADTALSQTTLEGLGEMYCFHRHLQLYSEDSPFYDRGWQLIGFVAKRMLHTASKHVRSLMVGAILATAFVAFTAIFAVTYFATRKIAGLSAYIQGIDHYDEIQFERTGLQEIDELSAAVERLNRSVINSAKITDKIMELTNMPLGCFESRPENPYVVVTGYVYDLLGLDHGSLISQAEWRQYYGEMTARPSEEHEQVYQFRRTSTQTWRWLRISETDTETSWVGTIMDVTEEIDDLRYLAQKLDYDILTRLNNRSAFKRKVNELLQARPDTIGAMVFIDLDNLKQINDTYGHDVGDRYLIRASRHIGAFDRYGAIVSRISGDEFAVYMHGFDGKDELLSLVRRQFEAGRNVAIGLPDGQRQHLEYSGGIAWYPRDSNNVTDLLKLADYAMYEAKHKHKGTLVEFDPLAYRQFGCPWKEDLT